MKSYKTALISQTGDHCRFKVQKTECMFSTPEVSSLADDFIENWV